MGRESNLYLLGVCAIPDIILGGLHMASQLILRRTICHIYICHHPTDKNISIKQLQLLLKSHIASMWLRQYSDQVWLNSKSLLISPLHVRCPWLSVIWELKAGMRESSVSAHILMPGHKGGKCHMSTNQHALNAHWSNVFKNVPRF